ncbi:MAG: hypothetical protein KGI54_17745, partial [Pseudomonadota bacterium]|nr:hypothetical protein [Pseudomonadota bacterium]
IPPSGVIKGLGANGKTFYIQASTGQAMIDADSVSTLYAKGWSYASVQIPLTSYPTLAAVPAGTSTPVAIGNNPSLINNILLLNSNTASQNTAILQSALNNGGDIEIFGSGTFFINATLIINQSNTTLKLHQGVQIKGSVGTDNLLTTDRITATKSSVTVTWTAGMLASVAWTNHGLVKGDKVWLVGAAQYQFIGVFTISSITDANNFVVNLRRLPTTTATGTITALKALENITIEGGSWSYNYSGGNTGTGYSLFTMLLGGVYNLKLRNIDFEDTAKAAVCVGASNGVRIEALTSRILNSDFVKIYGPAFDTKIDGLVSDCGDDIISVQVKEPAAYASYIWTWGDVINADIKNINGLSTTQSMAIYPNQTGFIDAIKISNISDGCLTISANDSTSTSSNVGTVTLDNSAASDLNVCNISSLATLLTINSLVINNPSCQGVATNRIVSFNPTANVNASVVINGGYANNIESILNNSSTGVVNFTINGFNCGSVYNAFTIGQAGTTNININQLNHVANPGLRWLNSTAAGHINFNVDNLKMASGNPVMSVTGGATITAFGGGLPIDLASLSRATPAQLAIAAVNAGTILAGNLAVNDATNTTNSWKQVSNTTLVY